MRCALLLRGYAILVVGSVVACAPGGAIRAIEHGDRAALRGALERREKAGDLSAAEAARLARAVAEHELRFAAPDQALDRVRDLRPCARALDGALADRMRVHDVAGAQAALARIDGHGLDLDAARAFVIDAAPAWRAVGVRALVRAEDRADRLQALLDPEPLVRRSAARAERDAPDAGDLAALAEAARVDPEPVVRVEALRAIAALSPLPGDSVALALRDLWTTGDDALREEIALAWAAPAVWARGGREALRWVVAAGRGSGVTEAAVAVLRHPDAEVHESLAAVAQLVSEIAVGSRAGRIQALAHAPLDRPPVLAAVQAAAGDEDMAVRVAALGRLASVHGARSLADLEALAQPGSAVAAQARLALAAAGDRRVQAWLEQDLAASDTADRLGAAVALATLGVATRAAPLLADESDEVRTRAACVILTGLRSSF